MKIEGIYYTYKGFPLESWTKTEVLIVESALEEELTIEVLHGGWDIVTINVVVAV